VLFIAETTHLFEEVVHILV